MIEYQIGKNEAGQRLDKYLRKLFPQAPNSFLYKMLRKKNIEWNGKKASGSVRLSEGDRIQCWLSDETIAKFQTAAPCKTVGAGLPKPDKLDILYEDADILAINKPAGMLAQKSRPSDISANEYIIQYLLESGAITQEGLKTFHPSVCNRLDRNTSGILTAGKTLLGLQDLSAQFRERTAQKYYFCIAIGKVQKPGHLSGYLKKDPAKNQVYLNQEQLFGEHFGEFFIETEYEPVQAFADFTFLQVHLITGRTHQIRAHLASVGHAVAGDYKYGDPKVNAYLKADMQITRPMLHAGRLVLKGGREITAPLPEDFTRMLQYLKGTCERI